MKYTFVSLANSKIGALGVRDHLMRRNTFKMSCRTDMACGIANADHNQIRSPLLSLSRCPDSLGRLAVFHGHFRRTIKFHVLR